jgi:hypothetical protein
MSKNLGQLDLLTAAEIVPGIDRVYIWDASEVGVKRSKGMTFGEFQNFLNTAQSGAVKVPFSYGDATPKAIAVLPAGSTVFTAAIVITVPFDGMGAALALGDADVGDRLMTVAQNDPTSEAEYETNPGVSYPTDTQILLTINSGAGTTAGAGYVLLEV